MERYSRINRMGDSEHSERQRGKAPMGNEAARAAERLSGGAFGYIRVFNTPKTIAFSQKSSYDGDTSANNLLNHNHLSRSGPNTVLGGLCQKQKYILIVTFMPILSAKG
jgi:hypothetical protein